MNYANTAEQENARKSEQIFLAVVTKAAFDRGWMDADGESELDAKLIHVLKHGTKAWRTYTKLAAEYDQGDLDAERARAVMEAIDAISKAQDIAGLRQAADYAKSFGLDEKEKGMAKRTYTERQELLKTVQEKDPSYNPHASQPAAQPPQQAPQQPQQPLPQGAVHPPQPHQGQMYAGNPGHVQDPEANQ